MLKFEYENLIIDNNARTEFFSIYDHLIKLLKRNNFFDAAIIHTKNRKRIDEELALLD